MASEPIQISPTNRYYIWDNRSYAMTGGQPTATAYRTDLFSGKTFSDAATDAIELFNDSLDPINVGGWFLTDDFQNPFKYRIPDNTIIPDLGYLVLTEAAFNPTNPPSPNAFAFSSSITGGIVHREGALSSCWAKVASFGNTCSSMNART